MPASARWKAIVDFACFSVHLDTRWVRSTIAGTMIAISNITMSTPTRSCPDSAFRNRSVSARIPNILLIHHPDFLNRQLELLLLAEVDRLAHRDGDRDQLGVVRAREGEGD